MTFSLTIRDAETMAAEALAAVEAALTTAIDTHVEARARALGYNSAAACAGYRESTVTAWADEAAAFIAWRDAVWQTAFDLQAQHLANQTIPEAADVLAALPVWGA